jgi:bacteriorhodopsin
MFVLCFSWSETVKDKNSITKLMWLVVESLLCLMCLNQYKNMKRPNSKIIFATASYNSVLMFMLSHKMQPELEIKTSKISVKHTCLL